MLSTRGGAASKTHCGKSFLVVLIDGGRADFRDQPMDCGDKGSLIREF